MTSVENNMSNRNSAKNNIHPTGGSGRQEARLS
jgi:hypothetical protein